MKLSRQEIFEKEFSVSFRGYNQQEVDAFLDQILNAFDEMERQIGQAEKEQEALRQQIARYQAIERTLNETMLTAQRAAADIVMQAEKQKEELLTNAMADAAEIQDRAQREADAIQGETMRICAAKKQQANQMIEKAKTARAAVLQVLAYQSKELGDLPIADAE